MLIKKNYFVILVYLCIMVVYFIVCVGVVVVLIFFVVLYFNDFFSRNMSYKIEKLVLVELLYV